MRYAFRTAICAFTCTAGSEAGGISAFSSPISFHHQIVAPGFARNVIKRKAFFSVPEGTVRNLFLATLILFVSSPAWAQQHTTGAPPSGNRIMQGAPLGGTP